MPMYKKNIFPFTARERASVHSALGCWHCLGWPYIYIHAIQKVLVLSPKRVSIQCNAKTKSVVAGTKLPTVEEVCLEDKFRSDKVLVSISIS